MNGQCLTPAQVETARLIYQGPKNPRTGAQIYPGFAIGSEADATSPASNAFAYGWVGIQGPLAQLFAIPLLRDMVYHDQMWDWRSFDWDKDVADIDQRVSNDITAVNPDLRAFQTHGGKLIMYQGWGDPLNGQALPIADRDEVIAVFSGRGKPKISAVRTVNDFFRVFMAPGMGHCGGGPGPHKFDALTAVRDWVEKNAAPDRLVATQSPTQSEASVSDKALGRVLCPFPKIARWVEQRKPDSEGGFECSGPQD